MGKIGAKIAKMTLVLAISACQALTWADSDGGGKRIAELKVFLDRKEGELLLLSSERVKKMESMESLARDLESRKAKKNPGWFEQWTIGKKMARLRAQAGEVKKLDDQERDARDDALAAAAAVVSEVEGQLEVTLVELRDAGEGASRRRLISRALELERERKMYQERLGALMPAMRVPPDLPAGAERTPEMMEDQRRSYEAAIARMQAEKDILAQEKRLARLLAETMPEVAAGDERLNPARLDLRMAVIDRSIAKCREKLARLPARPGKAD